MSDKLRDRSKKVSRPRRTKSAKARPSSSAVEFKRWWQVVRKVLVLRSHGDVGIPCGTRLGEQKGSDKYIYHDISTKYANWPSGAYVDFTSPSPVVDYGLGVPVTYVSKPSGYSFSGSIPVCTKSSICTNGQPMVHQVDVSGELNTSSVPDELSYNYTVYVYCGNVLTCIETGSFKGERESGSDNTLDGEFYGEQTWTVQCCPKRHAIKT